MKRTPIIAGNWKMYKTRAEAHEFAASILKKLGDVSGIELAVCAPFTALDLLSREFANSPIGLGAQTMHEAQEGAYTGEISAPMLNELGVSYVILGHSERRAHFNETDDSVNRKLAAALQHGLTPIVCVGENLEEREQNRTFEVVEAQTRAAFQQIAADDAAKSVIAYEPIWAIGTGRTATAQDADTVCGHIRKTLTELYGSSAAESVRIQYGGSVKPENIASILEQPQIDGALVGGASLDPDSYLALVKGAMEGAANKR